MSGLKSYLLGRRIEQTQDPDTPIRALEENITEIVCRLCDETQKTTPDERVVGTLLDDLEILVSDYRREKGRRRIP